MPAYTKARHTNKDKHGLMPVRMSVSVQMPSEDSISVPKGKTISGFFLRVYSKNNFRISPPNICYGYSKE